MNAHSKIRQQLFDYAVGGLDIAARKEAEAHLATCNSCSSNLKALRVSLNILQRASHDPSAQRTEQFWNSFAYNVQDRIRKNEREPSVSALSLVQGIRSLLVFRRPYVIGAGSAAAALIAAILAWTFMAPDQPDLLPRNQAVAGHTAEQDTSARRISQYFRKSRALLVGLSNTNPSDHMALELNDEKELSRQLVLESRYLKRQPIDPRSSRLIDDLDKVLIKLSNTNQGKEEPDIELIRSGIRRENLLFKLRMAEFAYTDPLITTVKNSF